MSKVDVDAFFGSLVSILDKWVSVLPSRECEWQMRERGISIFSMLIFMSLYRCRQICVTFSGELVNGIIVAEDSAKIVGPGIRDGSYTYVQIHTEVGDQL